MIRPLRRRHRWMWLVIGPLALAALAWGILSRPPATAIAPVEVAP